MNVFDYMLAAPWWQWFFLVLIVETITTTIAIPFLRRNGR